MSVLTRDERRELTKVLIGLPNIDDPHARENLLIGLPDDLQTAVTHQGATQTVIRRMLATVDGDTWAVLGDGTVSVLVLIDNALDAVRGSASERQLTVLAAAISARQQSPATPTPAVEQPDRDPPVIVLHEVRRLLVEIQERVQTALEQMDRLQPEAE